MVHTQIGKLFTTQRANRQFSRSTNTYGATHDMDSGTLKYSQPSKGTISLPRKINKLSRQSKNIQLGVPKATYTTKCPRLGV